MKILFICGSLEPGRDGVGDYTRRLAAECIRQGVDCQAIALNDRHLESKDAVAERQQDGGTEFSCLRFASTIPWRRRVEEVFKRRATYDPTVISLQYVPYSFHRKGIPVLLPGRLRRIANGVPWHVMLHETWIGFSTVSSWNHRAVGTFQKAVAKSLVKRLSPVSVTTSNKLYVELLQRADVSAERLPLFGNFPHCAESCAWLKGRLTSKGIDIEDRTRCFIAGILGSVDVGFDLDFALRKLQTEASSRDKTLLLIAAGKVGNADSWSEERILANPGIQAIHLGYCDASQVSAFLQLLDVGLPGTQRQMLGKSGVAAAMHNHNVPLRVFGDRPLPDFDSSITDCDKDCDLFVPLEIAAKTFIETLQLVLGKQL